MREAFKPTGNGCPQYDVEAFTALCEYPPVPASEPMSVTSTTPIMPPIVMPEDCVCLSFDSDSTKATAWSSNPNAVKIYRTSSDCCDGGYEVSADINVPCPLSTLSTEVRNLSQSQAPTFSRRADSSTCEGTLTLGLPCVPTLSSSVKFVGDGNTSVSGGISLVSGDCTNMLTGTVKVITPKMKLKGIGCSSTGTDSFQEMGSAISLQSSDDSNVRVCVGQDSVTFGVYYV